MKAKVATTHDGWTKEREDLVSRQFLAGFSADEIELFIATCKRTGLSPEARQIYASSRWDKKKNREILSIQTSIDGFRLIAERTGKYAGQLGPFWCSEDGNWKDAWLNVKVFPCAAKLSVLRNDFKEPLTSVAVWDSYVGKGKDGQVGMFWKKMPDLMLAKCAEALALRRAFPQELSGLYTEDEMQNATTHAEPARPFNQDSPQTETRPTSTKPTVTATATTGSLTPTMPTQTTEPSESRDPPAASEDVTEYATPDDVKKMLDAFEALGVSHKTVSTFVRKGIDAVTMAELKVLRKLYLDMKKEKAKTPRPKEETVSALQDKFSAQ